MSTRPGFKLMTQTLKDSQSATLPSKRHTPEEEREVQSQIGKLACRKVEVRAKAAADLGSLSASGPRMAALVGKYIDGLLYPLKVKKEDSSVCKEVLSALRSLCEQGQTMLVSMNVHLIMACLDHKDEMVQRKASTLVRIMAEEGCAASLTMYVRQLMDYYEVSGLLAPMEALTAIADAGEATAVASVVPRIARLLQDPRSSARAAACNALSAMCRGGALQSFVAQGLVERVDSLRCQTATGAQSDRSLLKMLLTLVLDDQDCHVQHSASLTLQAMVLGDSSIATVLNEKYDLLMFNCMNSLWGVEHHESRSIMAEILGLKKHTDAQIIKKVKAVTEQEGEVCAICLDSGLRCQRGGPQELPCGHTFHADCINEWFSWKVGCGHQRTCPICRDTEDASAVRPASAEATPDPAGRPVRLPPIRTESPGTPPASASPWRRASEHSSSVERVSSVVRLRTAVETLRAAEHAR